MSTFFQDATTLTFSYENDNIIITIQSKQAIVEVDKRDISTIPISAERTYPARLSKTYSLNADVPLTVMRTMIDDFKELFRFANIALDQVVKETMSLFNDFDKLDRTAKVTAMNVVSLRKSYAKYFYTVLKNKTTSINTNASNSVQTSDRKKTAQIIIELVNWFFMRRFVHIYVVCTCLEKLLQLAVVASNNIGGIQPSTTTTPQPQPINWSSSSTPPPNGFSLSSSTTGQTGTFQVTPKVVQQQISALDSQLNRLNIVSSSGSGMSDSERASLTTALQDTRNTLIDQQNQNAMLAQDLANSRKELDNLRELLLSSTSMIFKMDELLPTT
jgi:hypothetical protein